MHIISYRGPNAAGGVSNALTQITNYPNVGNWLYIRDNALLQSHRDSTTPILNLEETLCTGHYRYCNNYLWPILHELGQYAHYSEHDHQCYLACNKTIALKLSMLNWHEKNKPGNIDGYFINDYQFASLPAALSRSDTFLFWHVPWPRQVAAEHLPALKEIAVGLLHTQLVGFHTDEYRNNFLDFISSYLPNCRIDAEHKRISFFDPLTQKLHQTQVLVAPLGLDLEYWTRSCKLASTAAAEQPPGALPFILSVDRADYTKGIKERLAAIDKFFENHSEWREKIYFRQIGTRSREGLPEFDRYWRDCHHLKDAINQRWSTTQWCPVEWNEKAINSFELAKIYGQATVMLVTPWRDGLNLTAKEYVACQASRAGVLALSKGTGAWQELGPHSILASPENPAVLAETIAACLELTDTERYRRMCSLKETLADNTLTQWWQVFLQACAAVQNSKHQRHKYDLATGTANKAKTQLRTNTA